MIEMTKDTAPASDSEWVITGPDGRQWRGESPLRVCAAARRDTIDPVLAMARINAIVAEETALHDREMADEFERGRQQGMQQERALLELAKSSQEIEAAGPPTDQRKALAEKAHKARRKACSAWSNLMASLCGVGQPTHQQRLDSTLRTMRQLWEEVVGLGFYSPEREAEYAAMAAALQPKEPKE